jgi:hypothetical protein
VSKLTVQSRTLPGKGHKHGECERTACTNPDARWYNPHTNAYYCQSCALKLNDELRSHNLIQLRRA